MNNNKGFGLLEVMVAAMLSGIISVSIISLLGCANRTIVKLQAAGGNTSWSSGGQSKTGVPIICFSGQDSLGCDQTKPAKACTYLNGSWQRNNAICDNGVLLINQ